MNILIFSLESILSFVVCFLLTFTFYAAVIKFRSLRDDGTLATLAPVVTVCIKIILYVGLVLDAILNIVFLTAYYWEIPKEVLSTFRVKRWYWSEADTRNKRKSVWFAKNFLLPIDPHHMDK
jgi:hypothetical protein